ncbi:MAG: flagellum-specific ATP synthase FliI, partial [Oleiphilaceae bacterium]|nr:flagellum-specific ATP synthase FliI [Oleiphilaceae bacterium]
SISRVMPHVVAPEHLKDAQRFKQTYARYQQARDLISVGAYVPGSDPQTDFAIERIDRMKQFLQQSLNEAANAEASVGQMRSTIAPGRDQNTDQAPARAQ